MDHNISIHDYYPPANPGVVVAAFLLDLLAVLFLVLVLFLLLHGAHRKILQVRLAANTILPHLPILIFIHPASIILFLMRRPISFGYCSFKLFMWGLTLVLVPYTFMMFTIERLMFIRKPVEHAQKITRAGSITLLVFPWIFAFVLSTVVFGFFFNRISLFDPKGYHGCLVSNFASFTMQDLVIQIIADVFVVVIPMGTTVIVTIVVLGMWACFKRRHALGVDYAMMGSQVEIAVRNSVIAIAVLNGVFVPVYIAEMVTLYHTDMGFIMISVFGVFQGITWIALIPEVRFKFLALVRKHCGCGRQAPSEQSVHYDSNPENDGDENTTCA